MLELAVCYAAILYMYRLLMALKLDLLHGQVSEKAIDWKILHCIDLMPIGNKEPLNCKHVCDKVRY